MLIPTFQMRAPSKRWIVVAGVLVTSLISIAWSFDRFADGSPKNQFNYH